jgi:tRNA nucleotidyltransferase (CCA-adding enzyme)
MDEISTLAHKVGDLFEPDAVFLLVDLGDRVQLVARSSSSSIDVGSVATIMGGGGHARAAAALVRDRGLADVKDWLVTLLRSHVEPAVTVSQIMSYGVQTLTPDTTVAEAAERMQQLGHEGFPVVDNGRVVGMLTRAEIDRAVRHDLTDAPIKRYMAHGEVHVTPLDPVERVQSIVRETGWGQVPVVDEASGGIVGIVTRTDLIRLWTTPEPSAGQSLAIELMHDLLPDQLLSLLKSAGEASTQMGFSLYASVAS